MKNTLKSILKPLAFVLLVSTIFACSKNEQKETKETNKDFRITIEHTGDTRYYLGYLTVNGSLDANQKGVAVSGIAWDSKTTVGESTIYEKKNDPINGNLEFRTDRKGARIQFGYSAWYTGPDKMVHTPVVVTFKYYVDGKLVKTENYTASPSLDGKTYNGSLTATDF